MRRWFLLFSYPVIQLFSYPVAEAFTDVSPDYLYFQAVEQLEREGIVQGYGDDTYRVEAPVTRAELLKMIGESFPEAFRPHCQVRYLPFPDVGTDDWFASFVCQAVERDLVSGYEDGFFRPHRFVNVAEVAKIISQLKWPVLESDQKQAPWFDPYLERLEAVHYLLPTFVHPSDLVNRGEMAELIVRMKSETKSKHYSAYDSIAQSFIPLGEPPVTPIPWKLNLEVLPRMRLEGRDFEIGEAIFENSFYATYPIRYLSNGTRVSGLMNVPGEKMGSGPFPVLVLAHGYYDRDLYRTGTGMRPEQDYFVRQGFVTIHPDYRGHAESDRDPENRRLYDGAMGYTMDVVNLVRALKKQTAFNTDQLFFMGHSMGGGIGLNIATMFPGLFQKIVLYAPAGGNAWENYQRWWHEHEENSRALQQWRSLEENPWSWDHLSSKAFLDRITDPIMIFHGSLDGRTPSGVPTDWSDRLAEGLDLHGKAYQYYRVKNAGHLFYGKHWSEMVEAIRDFFLE